MALIVTIKVTPNAGKQQFFCDKSGNLKCYLKSVPEQGKANQELVKLLSKALSLPQDDVSIIQGATNRTKKVKINTAITMAQLLPLLGIHLQTTISG